MNVRIVYCQVEVSAKGSSLVQMILTDCGVSRFWSKSPVRGGHNQESCRRATIKNSGHFPLSRRKRKGFGRYLVCCSRSHRPRGLRNRSTAVQLLRSWVRVPPKAWMFFCCVLSGRNLCDELITRPEESYQLWRVVVCDRVTSWTRRP
jgi:hypothetical protein